jgi:hypothetical protein
MPVWELEIQEGIILVLDKTCRKRLIISFFEFGILIVRFDCLEY